LRRSLRNYALWRRLGSRCTALLGYSMDFKVTWSDQAVGDLRELCAYIARHDPEAALRMGNGSSRPRSHPGAVPFYQTAISSRSARTTARDCFSFVPHLLRCARNSTKWTFCTFVTGLVTSLHSERPNPAVSVDAPTLVLSSRGLHPVRRATEQQRCKTPQT
jgi:hypothetical protein